MLTKEEIASDSRFYLDDFNLNRLTICDVKAVRLKKIKVGRIHRYFHRKIMSLYDTDVYKYLEKTKESTDNYLKYCNVDCKDNEKRNLNNYNELINSFDITNYDIKKGAIVVDGFNTIIEGQHRCCILLKKYGPDLEIEVVQFIYNTHEFEKLIKVLAFDFTNFSRRLLHRNLL